MNVFHEFYKVAERLRANDVRYALVGGVAMAFHTRPRFTKDIDLLVPHESLEKVSSARTLQNQRPWDRFESCDGKISFA